MTRHLVAEDPNISTRVRHLLFRRCWFTLERLSVMSEEDLLRVYMIGPKTVDEIRLALNHVGLRLRDNT